MKLLFVGYLHGFGGAERQLIMLSNEMSRRGHSVYLLSLSQDNPCYSIEQSVNYLFNEDKSNKKILNIYERFKYLKQQIIDIEPDLIVSFNVQPAFMCALMKKEIAQKTIYAERGDPYDKEYTGINGRIRDYMMNHIGGFVFQTNGAMNYFPDIVKRKSVVINNPILINPNDYLYIEGASKRIVTVGRLHEQKNQKLFIQSVAMLPKEYKDYSAEIYGEGALREELKKQIDESNSNVKIKLMGAHKDVLKRIQGADLFVLTSDYEGMPNALMEAMALGIPCISTDCRPGGARELIENGESGLIVPCRDEKALYVGIKSLLDNKDLAEKMSALAKQRVKNLLPEKIYSQWEQYFKEQCHGIKN